MKNLVVGSVIVGIALVGSGVFGAEKAANAAAVKAPAAEKPAKKVQPAPEAVTLTGKVVKEEKVTKDKAGAEVKKTHYLLVEADGTKIALPPAHAKAGEAAAYDLEKLVDKDVKVVGKATVQEKDGKKHVSVKSIESITEEVAAAPAAPAAGDVKPAAGEEKK